MPALLGRHWTLGLGLALLVACTRANPAFRITGQKDAGEDTAIAAVPEAAAPDRAAGVDLPAAADRRASEDVTPEPSADAGLATTGLVGYWPLDEGSGSIAADATGDGNSGALQGAPTWVSGGFPAARFANPGALELDGENDWVEITTRSIPGNAAAKTVAAWFKASNATALPIRNLVALINDTADLGIQLGLDHGRVAAWFYGAAAPTVFAAAAVDGTWHHAAYSFDGKTHRIYYDGKLEMTKDLNPDSGPITHLRLGTYQAPDEMFAGTVDDVRVYDRALADGEIAALWSGQ